MRASDILLKALGDMPEQLEPRLRRVLLDAAEALLNCHRLTLTDLGRSLPRDCGRKHAVKCMDRLLKNPRIEASRPAIAAALAADLFKETTTPLLLVDWTETGPGFWALSAATPIGGRTIALYHEVHPTSLQANPLVEREFLKTLKERIVPKDCKPIVVTDSGFGTPWFEAVCAVVGWDYVGRLGGGMQVRRGSDDVDANSPWETLTTIYGRAQRHPVDLGAHLLTKAHEFSSRLVLHKRPPKGRKAGRKPNRKGVHPGSHAVKTARKRAKEPWLLATSLVNGDASAVVACYAKRFQIEETFRDTKSHRFGFSFEDAGSRTECRLNNLLLIAILAAYATTVLGIAAETEGIDREMQANTIRHRRVFSLFTLGRFVLTDSKLFARVIGMLAEAVATLRDLAKSMGWPAPLAAHGGTS